MKIATVILARRGSSRLKEKLMREFGGKPLINWTLSFAERLGYPAYIYTDITWKEMTDQVKRFSVELREKQFESLSGEHRTSDELREYNKEIQADILILLQGTSPLRDLNTYSRAIEEFLHSGCNCGMAVAPFNKFIYSEGMIPINSWMRGYSKKLNQFVETGAFYIFPVSQLDKTHLTNGRIMPIIDRYGIDIDTESDLVEAELKYKNDFWMDGR